jgi:inorganic pyrophosphatase
MSKDRASLADPTKLMPYDGKRKQLVQVIVETPKGSRNKYAFDNDQKIFELKKVLPSGMDFPYDFGFVPSTEADDGDPVDVLLLMDESAFPGCLVKARLIGVILGGQHESNAKKKERNDRLVAVAEKSHLYGHITHIDELEDSFIQELEKFFVNYHALEGSKFSVLGKRGSLEAGKLLKKARKKAKG